MSFDRTSLAATPPSPISPPFEMNCYAAPLTQAVIVPAEAEWPEQKVVEFRSLARGVRWALTIEGAAAAGLYAIWHLLLLWR